VGAESFTLLAILEARDVASEYIAKVDESLEKLGATSKAAADEVYESGVKIDEALGRDVSAADRLEVSAGRVAAAQAQARESAATLTAAENELRDAQASAAAGADDDAAAQARLIAASKAVSAAQKDAAASAGAVRDAQASEGAALRASAAAGDENAAAQLKGRDASEESAASLGKIGKIAGITALGLGVAAAVMVKAAGNFQSSTAHLVTDAGESQKNLAMVQAGILNISTATGTSATDITNAMYHIESGGIHAGAGLAVAKVAAEGAKVGGADLDTVSKTLVGTLNSYGMTSKNSAVQTQYATRMMNMLIATVGSGDMRMQDLASSLGSVTPLAAAAGLSFSQVGGAVATMTSQNMTAQRATQDLDNLLRNIVKPSKTASTEMRYLGISANQVSTSLKGQGLTGVMNEFTQAILKNTQGGMVSLGFYKQMTPATQAWAQGILAGKVTTQDLTNAMKGMTPQQAQVITQFKAAAVSATGLKQTYTGALASLTGGATGLNTSLMLTGKNASVFAGNVAKIGAEGKKAGTSVDNWSVIQGTFNQKIDLAKTAVENTGIAIGSALLPAVTAVVSAVGKVLIPVAEFPAKHKTLTLVVFAGVTAFAALVAVLALTAKVFKAVKGAVDEVKSAVNGATALMRKLGLVSKQTADTQKKNATEAAETQEAKAEESATVQEEQSAEAAAAQEGDAAEVAAANATSAAESSGSWITAAASTVGQWAKAGGQMIASAAKWVAEGALKVAAYVAENVFGAEATETAWTLANAVMLLGIGLVIAAVVIAVVEIVKHWNTITAAVSKVWHDVFEGTKEIISDVISFIKSHWALIVGIFLGPIALVVALVVQHWKLIEHYFQDGVQAVEKALSWFGGLQGRFRSWLGGAASAVASEGGKILRWFAALPGKVVSEVAQVATDLFSSGEHIIERLAAGITSAAGGALHSAMSFVANTVKSFLPFSPARQGPLSGAGDPGKSGLAIATNLGKGITAATPQAAAAALQMAARVQAATSGLSARAGTAGIASSLAASAVGPASGTANGGVTIVVDVHGNTVIGDSDIAKLTNAIGKKLASVTLPAAGRKMNIRG
jgi:Phage-related minor tail protein